MQAVRPETLEGAELVSVKNFMLNREGASQNPLLQSFMDIRTNDPALSLEAEEDKTTKKSDSIYDMDGILTEEQKLKIQYLGGRAGSSIQSYEELNEEEKKERDKKDAQASRQLAALIDQAKDRYEYLYDIAERATAEHRAAQEELQKARQELAQAEVRVETTATQVEEHQQDIANATIERRQAVAAAEDQTVTINGQTIRYDKDSNSFRDEEGAVVGRDVLEASTDPAALDLMHAQDAKQAEWDLMRSGRGLDYQAEQARQDLQQAEQEEQEAARREAEAREAAERAEAEAEAARQDLQDLKDQQATLEGEAPSQEVAAVSPVSATPEDPPTMEVASLETEDSIHTSPRTASAVGETGLVEENRLTAPSIRGAFKSSAEGTNITPETPDTGMDNTQTIDIAAVQQQQMMQQQFGMRVG